MLDKFLHISVSRTVSSLREASGFNTKNAFRGEGVVNQPSLRLHLQLFRYQCPKSL